VPPVRGMGVSPMRGTRVSRVLWSAAASTPLWLWPAAAPRSRRAPRPPLPGLAVGARRSQGWPLASGSRPRPGLQTTGPAGLAWQHHPTSSTLVAPEPNFVRLRYGRGEVRPYAPHEIGDCCENGNTQSGEGDAKRPARKGPVTFCVLLLGVPSHAHLRDQAEQRTVHGVASDHAQAADGEADRGQGRVETANARPRPRGRAVARIGGGRTLPLLWSPDEQPGVDDVPVPGRPALASRDV